jgi:hypothetical protein
MKCRRYGQKILPQEFAVALPYVERREALGGTSNEVNTVDLVHTLALDLINTLAGIFERAEDIKPD